MKKFLFTVMAALLGMGNAVADEYVVSDIEIPQGGSATIEIGMNNPDTESRGFQFVMSFDKAVTASHPVRGTRISMKDPEQDEYLYSLMSQSTEEGFKVLAYTTSTESITGTSGTVVSITLTADESLAVGTTVTGTLSDCLIGNTAGTTNQLDDVTFSITITEKTYTVLDETSTTAPASSDGKVDIKVQRTIKANEWSTICLPFAMTGTQVRSAFGEDVQLANFIDYEVEEDDYEDITGLTINFEEVNASAGMEANYPYLIKVSSEISEFEVKATIETDEEAAVVEYDNGKTGSRRKVYGSLIGTYHAGDAIPANGLFLSGNQFWYSTGETRIKAFRAYFMFVDVLTEVEGASANIRYTVYNEATGIADVKSPMGASDGWYTLDGRRLDRKPAERGVYIMDGKKVSIR